MNTEHEKNPAAVALGRRGAGKPKTLSEAQREALAENMRLMVRANTLKAGDQVIYTHDDGSETAQVVRSTKAIKLGGHTWVIWLEGISGCVALARVRKAPETPPENRA